MVSDGHLRLPGDFIFDAIGNHHVAFDHPTWVSGSDQDPEQAVKSRNMLLDRAVEKNMQLVGFHLPSSGIGRVEKDGSGYRFIQ